MSDVCIRPFAAGDKELVSAFFDQMGGETRAFFNRGDWNRQVALKYFDGSAPYTDYFLAELDTAMVGYVFLFEMDTAVPCLGIAVAEGYKGHHLGRKLIQCAIDRAKTTGKGGIWLTTHIANLRGQGLYERMGFQRMGIHNSGEILYLLRF